jgi:hypothetical protein
MKYIFFFLLLLFGIEVYRYIDFLHYSHFMIVGSVMNKYSNTYLIETFPILFTRQRFELLQLALPVILMLQLLFFGMIYHFRIKILQKIKLLLKEIRDIIGKVVLLFKKLTVIQIFLTAIIFIGIILVRVYLVDKYPFSGDEALSYFTFVNNGFLMTLTFYPEPNNHILYNLITIVFDQFMKDPVYIMRVPNIILNILLLTITFVYLLGKRNFTTAILFLIIAGFSFSTSIYAIQGRGYMLLSLFTMIAVISTVKLTETPGSILAFFSLVVSSILGIYTIPLFFFLFAGLATYLGYFFFQRKQYQNFKFVLKYFLFVNIGWVLLYLPIFLVSGIETVFNNEIIIRHHDLRYYFFFVVPVSLIEAINFILGTYSDGYYLMFFLGLFILVTYKVSKDDFFRNFIKLTSINIFLFILFMLVRKVFGEFRIFTMYGFFFAFILSLSLSYWINKIRKPVVIYSIILCIALFFASLVPLTFYTKMDSFYGNNYFQFFKKISDDVAQITSTHPQNVYVSSKAHLLYLKLYNSQNHAAINIYTPNSLKKIPYDYVIVDKRLDVPWENYHPETSDNTNKYEQIGSNAKVLIYKRK